MRLCWFLQSKRVCPILSPLPDAPPLPHNSSSSSTTTTTTPPTTPTRQGYAGPLCVSCLVEGTYWHTQRSVCASCPSFASRFAPWLIFGSAGLLAIASAVVASRKLPERRWTQIRTLVTGGSSTVKIKLLVSFFQVTTPIPSTYRLRIPDVFRIIMTPLNFIKIDWDYWLIPAPCVSFEDPALVRMALSAGIPFMLTIAVFLSTLSVSFYREHKRKKNPEAPTQVDAAPSSSSTKNMLSKSSQNLLSYLSREAEQLHFLMSAVHAALPYVLVLMFIFVPSVSQSIFRAWYCRAYVEDTQSSNYAGFLELDLRIQCTDPNYRRQLRSPIHR